MSSILTQPLCNIVVPFRLLKVSGSLVMQNTILYVGFSLPRLIPCSPKRFKELTFLRLPYIEIYASLHN